MSVTRTLSVRLQSDVVYVTGTVNDVPTTWTQQENNAWATTADRAADDVYRVDLELINSAGRTYTARSHSTTGCSTSSPTARRPTLTASGSSRQRAGRR